MNIDFTYSPWFILLCVILAGGLTFLMYQAAKETLPRFVRWALSIMRFIVFLVLAILLLEPLISSFTKVKFPPIIAILHDDTESLVLQKDSAFVRNEFPESVKSFLGELEKQEKMTHFYGFSNGMESGINPDSITYTRSGSNLSGALKETQNIYRNQNLGGVVLISDGISTSGGNLLYALEGFQQPVYTVLLGDTSDQKDVKIAEALYNEIAYLENETPIKVKINSMGFNGDQLTITLTHNGKVIGSKKITIDKNNPNRDVDFMVKPGQSGIVSYNIQVTQLKDEVSYRNNFKRVFINVLETRTKIALFAGSPHPDLGALHKAFKNDDRYEVVEFTHKDRQTYYTSPDNYNLSDFDLIILHNFPYSSQDGKVMGQIATEVKERNTPLMVFFGKFTDLETAKNIYPNLAITPSVANAAAEEAQLHFKPEYSDHSTFTFDREWIQLMNNAPPLLRNRSDWRAKGDAKVYATSTIRNVTLDYPIYALQNHLGRKNMVFIGENFWRIRSHSFVETGDFNAFDIWLLNNIQWLIVREDKRKFRVAPSKHLFTGNEMIIFKGQAYDDNYKPISGAEIKVNIKSPDGKENIYFMSETGDANYYLELSNLEEGTYNYTAEGKRGEIRIGTDRGQFSLGKSNIEHFNLKANKELMQQIALRTNGKFVYGRDLASLAPEILANTDIKPVSEEKKSRLGFHEIIWIFFVVLAMLTIEWITRKVYSLV